MKSLRIAYNFHPVGQGLFSSGALLGDFPHQRFHWIYDCGTDSGNQILTEAIDRLVISLSRRGPKPLINLLAISHFDRDHINGLTALLPKFAVEALLLPYMPLWQRLTAAAAEGIGAEEPLFAFFINPVAYVAGIDGGEVGRIILVPPSGDGESPPDGGEGAPPLGPDDSSWQLQADVAKPSDDDQQIDDRAFRGQAGASLPEIQFMKLGSTLRVTGAWEFVPYNDATIAFKANDLFRTLIATLQQDLINSPSPAGRAEALKEIKDTYTSTFGSGARPRNEISLFLYGGPLRTWQAPEPVWCSPYPVSQSYPDWPWFEMRNRSGIKKVTILYTGDGYLDKAFRAQRLADYLRPSRVRRIGTLQVMHHGSKENWYPGVAAYLDPHLSVFSSDPTRAKPGHPDQVVLNDFSAYAPIQVDKHSGCYVKTLIAF